MLSWISDIISLVFPPVCHLCGAALSSGERFVCSPCLSSLPRTSYHRRNFNPMEQRFAGLFPFSKATGFFFYSRDSALSQLIQDMKYRGFSEIGRFLGKTVATELRITDFFNDIDVIIPVPMHFLKKARRGYNQTELIAAGISEVTSISVSTRLKAIRPHRTQTALSLAQRRKNTDSLFMLRDPDAFAGKGILLVDDICTTGSTVTSAAEAILRAAPSARISVLTLGVTF